jgi:phage terminase large subunit GpA-like protein
MSDKRNFHVPCPHCGHPQVLVFEQVDADGYRSDACDSHWDDNQRIMAVRKGKWIAEKPGGKIAGFHISALYSFFVALHDVWLEYLAVKDDVMARKTFYNTVLGLPFQDEVGVEIADHELKTHLVDYGDKIPYKALILSSGVDVQKDRFEASIWAWSKTGESWRIAHRVIRGNPKDDSTKKELDNFLFKTQWVHQSGKPMELPRIMMDTGGEDSTETYSYIAPRQVKGLYGIKGHYKTDVDLIKKSKPLDCGVNMYMLNVSAIKRQLYYQLSLPPESGMYVNLRASTTTDADLEQLVSEKLVQVQKDGKVVETWMKKHPKIRNEQLDCWVYAYAGLKLKEPNWAALENHFHGVPLKNNATTTKVIIKNE